jgi:hypothetical protein
VTGCERCGRRLFFSARKAGNRWCQRCAAELGIEMIGDRARLNVIARAARLEPWWRWTVWLGRAIQLVEPNPLLDILEGR